MSAQKVCSGKMNLHCIVKKKIQNAGLFSGLLVYSRQLQHHPRPLLSLILR